MPRINASRLQKLQRRLAGATCNRCSRLLVEAPAPQPVADASQAWHPVARAVVEDVLDRVPLPSRPCAGCGREQEEITWPWILTHATDTQLDELERVLEVE